MNLTRKILGKYYDVYLIRAAFELIFVILPIAFAIRTFIFGLYQVPTGSMETTLLVGERFFADKLTYWFRPPARGEIIAFNDPKYAYSDSTVTNLWQRYVSWRVSNWTKRLIAVPGDHIKGVIEDGKPAVYLNGTKLDETSYVNKYPLLLVRNYSGNKTDGRDVVPKSVDPSKSWDQQPFYIINPTRIVLNAAGVPYVQYPGTPLGKFDIFERTLGDNQYWAMGDNRLGSSDSREWGILDGKLIHGRIVFRIWSMDSDSSYWIFDLIKNPIGFWKKIRWSRCLQFVS